MNSVPTLAAMVVFVCSLIRKYLDFVRSNTVSFTKYLRFARRKWLFTLEIQHVAAKNPYLIMFSSTMTKCFLRKTSCLANFNFYQKTFVTPGVAAEQYCLGGQYHVI